jgi:uncharacterized protein YkwD
MRKTASVCAFVIGLILLLGVSVPSSATSLSTVNQLPYRVATAAARADLETQMLAMLNRDRARVGLRPLAVSDPLTRAARSHGVDMFVNGYLSHTARSGSTPMDRMLASGARARMFGENLAFAADVATAHRLLMASPGHRANILSKAYHRIGIGVLDGGTKGVIVVENFTD